MARMDSPIRLTLTLVLLFCAAADLTGQAPTQPYKPVPGQPGKDVVWVPTPPETVDAMLDLADVTLDDVVVDLGSGDGAIVIEAARRARAARGIEYNPDLVELSRRRAAEAGVGAAASFVQGDMFAADFSDATVLALFLLPANLQKLTSRFLALAPGTRIVLNTFAIPGWEPDMRRPVPGDCSSWCEVLLYIVPARAAGTWQLPDGTLTLTQEFQMLRGTLEAAGQTLTIESGRLRGDEIRFAAGGAEYGGRVQGSRITGTVTAADGSRTPFTAMRIE